MLFKPSCQQRQMRECSSKLFSKHFRTIQHCLWKPVEALDSIVTCESNSGPSLPLCHTEFYKIPSPRLNPRLNQLVELKDSFICHGSHNSHPKRLLEGSKQESSILCMAWHLAQGKNSQTGGNGDINSCYHFRGNCSSTMPGLFLAK